MTVQPLRSISSRIPFPRPHPPRRETFASPSERRQRRPRSRISTVRSIVTDPRSGVYSYAYDSLNRLIRETDQETSQVNYTLDCRFTSPKPLRM